MNQPITKGGVNGNDKLRLTEAAKIAGLTPGALRYHIAAGNLKAEKPNPRLLLIARHELDAFLLADRPRDRDQMVAMARARWGDNAAKSKATMRREAAAPTKAGPAHLPGEPIIPPGVEIQRIPTPAPRFASVDLPGFTASTASTRVLRS